MQPGTIALLTFLVLASAVCASRPCFGHPHHGAKDRAIKEYLRDITQNPDDPGAALFAVLKPNGQYKSWTAGPISDRSMLRVGSITKMFTLKEWFEVHDDRIHHALNDHPSNYGLSPSQYQGSNVITYRQLASMTSGVLDYTINIGVAIVDGEVVWTPSEFDVPINVDLGWKNQSLTFAPGSQFLYSNTNCEVIALAVDTIGRNKPNKKVPALIKKRWRRIAPSLHIDDGLVADHEWPQTSAYLPWFYPVRMPGDSGTLVTKAEDLLRAFSVISEDRFMHFRRQWVDVPYSNLTGAGTQAGDKYGMFWQQYDIHGEAEGHDGDLVVRSIIIKHKHSRNKFFFHFAQPIVNSVLIQYLRDLVGLYL